MSIRVKLVLSNIAMVLIPVTFAFILAVTIIGSYLNNLDLTKYNHEDITQEDLRNCIDDYVTILYIANNNPEKFKELEYLENVEKTLGEEFLGLAVIIEDETFYITDKYKTLDMNFLENGEKILHFKNQDQKSVSFLPYELRFKDGSKGKVYFLYDSDPFKNFMKNFMENFIKGVFFILIFTTTILTFVVSRNIIRPIKKLKYGAEQIKEGNLSFELNEKSKDEIGQTCRAFEEMRIRLKGAIDEQLKMDENRIEFIASISHDLKTPITSIKGYVEGIMDKVADNPEKLDKYLKTIYSKAVDMDKLIDDLTFYSNQSLNKVSFNYSKVSIKRFFEDFIDDMQLDFESKGIKFISEYNLDENTKVDIDIEKFKRVVVNIVNNSIKFMDRENKTLKVSLEQLNGIVKIGFHDNGIGVDEGKLPYIFDRFYRADPSRNTSKGSSGLGLAIAKQIILEHGGRIWAKSQINNGMTIYIELDIPKRGDEYEKENINN